MLLADKLSFLEPPSGLTIMDLEQGFSDKPADGTSVDFIDMDPLTLCEEQDRVEISRPPISLSVGALNAPRFSISSTRIHRYISPFTDRGDTIRISGDHRE